MSLMHSSNFGGMDFGWDHPFAAVELVWDRESDVVYVAKTHRLKEATPIIHAARIAVGVAARRPPRDVGRGRRCPCTAIQGRGPQHAARARPVRGRQRIG